MMYFFLSDAEFRNTGLERSEKLSKDLEWFKEQGHAIPEPSSPGTSYASYLKELAEKLPPAFICHFYNVYFAHTAGGRMIGKKVSSFGLFFANPEVGSYIVVRVNIYVFSIVKMKHCKSSWVTVTLESLWSVDMVCVKSFCG